MQADHRIRYYATPLVRASVAKKLSALLSMDEQLFYQYFSVQDLAFDTWNDLDGLEIKPFYSPHPVETNIFLFRALGADGYRTYAHWADLTSFEVLQEMITDHPDEPGLSNEWYEAVKANYLLPVDLKKVDVGGGPIHGQVRDYATDRSHKIILAHASVALTPEQKEVDSNASFATMDVLIAGQQNYLRKQAAHYLQEYFPELPLAHLQILLNNEIDLINPGTIILMKGEEPQFVYLVLSGMVESIRSEPDMMINLSTGSFIGDIECLRQAVARDTSRSISHVKVLRLSVEIYKMFIESQGLLQASIDTQNNVDLLRKTWLFGERLSYLTQNRIAQSMKEIKLDAWEKLALDDVPGIYVLDEGELQLCNAQQQTIETLHAGAFCGEQSVLAEAPLPMTVQASAPSRVYCIDPQALAGIPIVHWKLLEVSANRKSRLDFS